MTAIAIFSALGAVFACPQTHPVGVSVLRALPEPDDCGKFSSKQDAIWRMSAKAASSGQIGGSANDCRDWR